MSKETIDALIGSMTHSYFQEAAKIGLANLELEKEVDVVDEDWLAGVSCNPDAPEECESCQ